MNAGKIVKAMAVILLIVSLIATVICSFAFAKDRYGDFLFGTFILILISGVAGSAFTCILLYAFGSLVDDTSSILSILSSDRSKSNRDAKTSTQTTTSNSNFRLTSVSEKGFSLPSLPSEEGWNCQKCGTFNKPTARVCEQCGKPRQK